VGDDAQGGGVTAVAEERSLGVPSQSRGSFLWGPLTRFALAIAVATAAVDQAAKLWLLFGLDLPARGIVRLTPFLDLVLTWNTGISYGLFPQDGPLGQAALLALKAIAVILLWIWLARTSSRLAALSLGLIIGGAIGNAIDRFAYGAVADFVLFHVTTADFTFNWYVFNLADVAIVAGVIGLLVETLIGPGAAKAPRS
jgi:signal peptidase II